MTARSMIIFIVDDLMKDFGFIYGMETSDLLTKVDIGCKQTMIGDI
jgi:hypothetical protein